jgi:hypothetical protein
MLALTSPFMNCSSASNKIMMLVLIFSYYIYKTLSRQIYSANTQIHVEITVKIYMQHTQEKPININTCINTQHVN